MEIRRHLFLLLEYLPPSRALPSRHSFPIPNQFPAASRTRALGYVSVSRAREFAHLKTSSLRYSFRSCIRKLQRFFTLWLVRLTFSYVKKNPNTLFFFAAWLPFLPQVLKKLVCISSRPPTVWSKEQLPCCAKCYGSGSKLEGRWAKSGASFALLALVSRTGFTSPSLSSLYLFLHFLLL